VELADGTTFAVGTGFSDAERENPPPIGSTISFRYQELSDGGVPRFPSYVGVRAEAPGLPLVYQEEEGVRSAAGTGPRRFECCEGGSSKFWEISTQGVEVTVRYGRIGSQGRTHTETFPDEAKAARHVEKLIDEKTKKGYQQIS
jgi:DNA ligase-1